MGKIIVNELSWSPSKESKEILKKISEEFIEGGFYGILGPNGSGKTSFIRNLLRLITNSTGHIWIGDKNLKDYTRKELATRLSFVPQNTFIDVNFTVYDIVAMGRTPYQGRFDDLSKKDKELIEEALNLTNTWYYKDKYFHQLSGGEAQRVLVARAIAQDTPWIILDEPISHLDIRHQVNLMETLKKLNEEKHTTIITILHDLNLSASYCKEIILMKEGTIYAHGDVDEVLNRENLRAVYNIDFYEQENKMTGKPYFMPILGTKRLP